MEPVSISCDECRLQGTSACDDCVVSFLCAEDSLHMAQSSFGTVWASVGSSDSDAIIIDAAEARAVKMLQRAGLLPKLRFERKVG